MMTAPLTGRKVLAITVSCFAVIVGVNLTLAFQAVATFPGLEAKNSYAASQIFDAEKAAQLALGWTVQADIDGDALILSIADKSGRQVEVEALDATLGRATHVNEDSTPDFTWTERGYVADVTGIAPGNWNLRMLAKAENGTVFRQRIVLYVRG